MVPASNDFLKFCVTILDSKIFKFVWCLGGFHLQITLNFLRYDLSYLYYMHDLLKYALPECPVREKLTCMSFTSQQYFDAPNASQKKEKGK